jgi:hypothetical protein
MFPLRFLLGVATGAIAVLLMNPNLANRARPVAKAILINLIEGGDPAAASRTSIPEAAAVREAGNPR